MRGIGKITFFLVLSLAATTDSRAGDEQQVLAIAHATVIDPATGSVRTDQTVVIAAGRIQRVVPSANYQPEKRARIIEARGKYLIPGLWDMHVHIAGISADPAWSKDVILPLLIAQGITAVRDMGGNLSVLRTWKQDIEAGKLVGPHIFAGGPMIVPSGKKTPEQWPVTTVEEAQVAVRELKQQGADFIKIISVPSREIFFAIAEEARKEKIPFVGHVPLAVTAAEASDAGMRSIEHIVYSNLSLDCSVKETELRAELSEVHKNHDQAAVARIFTEAVSTYSPDKASALWATFKKNGTWVTPTLASIEAQIPQAKTPEEQSSDPRLQFVPWSLRKEWDPLDPKNRASEDEQKWWANQYANDTRLTAEMHKAGVPLLAGSDSLDRFVFPGFALHQELALLNQQGLTPLETLRAATWDAARFLGHEAEFGVIANGARADLVLLNDNPLEKISNTTRIAAVIRGGVYLDRAELDRLLTRAKNSAKTVPK